MEISIIAAKSENNVIGHKNELIWYLPDDLKFFKSKTLGHHILMGRKTYQSLGKKLKGRVIIVVTRDNNFNDIDCIVVHSIEEGIANAVNNNETELLICGGGEIYKESINLVDKMYITEVKNTFNGDTYFPEYNAEDWNIVSKGYHNKDEKHPFPFEIIEYKRK